MFSPLVDCFHFVWWDFHPSSAVCFNVGFNLGAAWTVKLKHLIPQLPLPARLRKFQEASPCSSAPFLHNRRAQSVQHSGRCTTCFPLSWAKPLGTMLWGWLVTARQRAIHDTCVAWTEDSKELHVPHLDVENQDAPGACWRWGLSGDTWWPGFPHGAR